MKKFIAIIIFVVVSLIFSACSYGIDFAVINFSKEVIEVEYVITSQLDSLENTETKPYKMNLSDWNARFGKKKWSEVPQSEYEFDPKTRKCKIKLNPNEVLRISSQGDSVVTSENSDNFLIERLHLRGANGDVTYKENQFFKQFEEKGYSYRFIAYR